MFTALMLEQLVDAGKVHLSDPVEKYFPEIRAVQGRYPDAPPITLIQLATHTVGDLARFAAFLMDRGPESLLKSASLEAFQTQMMVPANVGLTSGYGIGFDVERRDDYVAFEHGGAVAGYTSMLIINRAKGIGVIVLSNGAANSASLAERALDTLSK